MHSSSEAGASGRILLVLFFRKAQYVQATAEVLWAVIPSWDDR